MNCRRFSELYSGFLDNALGAEEKTAVEEHLRYCLGCRRIASELRCLRQDLSLLGQDQSRGLNGSDLSLRIMSAIRQDAKAQVQSQNRRDEFFDRLRMRVFSQSVGTVVSVLLLLSVTTGVLGPAYRSTLAVARAAMNHAVVDSVGFEQLEAQFAVPDEVRIKILLLEPPPPPPVFSPSGAVLGIGETFSDEDLIIATVQVRRDGRASITEVVGGADDATAVDKLDAAAVDKLTNALIQHANFQPARRGQSSTTQAVLMFSKINIQG